MSKLPPSLALVALLAPSASAQSASDDFNRPNASTLGPDWVVVDGAFAIDGNQGQCNSPWSLGFAHHATLTGSYADSVQRVDFSINGFGGDSISLIAGLNPATWSAVEVRLQDNDGDGLFDRLFFNSAVNAGSWGGSNLFHDLATPIADGTMTLSFSGGGDVAEVTIDSVLGGTETFQGTGILSFAFPPSGDTFGVGGMGDSWFDDWNCTIGPAGPLYAINNLVAGQAATLEVSGIDPFDTVVMAYSLTGAGPTSTAYGDVAMSAPISFFPAVVADASGIASFGLAVPPNAAGRTIYSQALVLTTGVLSNALAATVQ